MSTQQEHKIVIDSLTLEWKENYVVYSDTDSMTDYFHSSRGSLSYMIELIQERGGDVIRVHYCNNEDKKAYDMRVARICKKCGYTSEKTIEARTPRPGETWNEIVVYLRRKQSAQVAPAEKVQEVQTKLPEPAPLVQSDDFEISLNSEAFGMLLRGNCKGI